MKLFKLSLALIFAGFLTIFLATVAYTLALLVQGYTADLRVAGGGCIVVMFIPICVGFGDPVVIVLMMIVALALIIASYVITRNLHKWIEKEVRPESGGMYTA
ncbi:MAG: hypothetical protein QW764_05575 [Desulfurococcaceae archaeon]